MRAIRKPLIWVLGKVGLEVRRLTPKRSAEDLLVLASDLGAGQVVEFIGVSGVGKSYFRRKLLSNIGSNWLEGSRIDWSSIEAGYLHKVPKTLDALYGALCKRLTQKAFDDDLWYDSSEQIMRFASFHLGNLRKHLLLEADLPVGVIMDEGLLFIARNVLIENSVVPAIDLKTILGRRLLIEIALPHDLVLAQIRKRHKEKPELLEYRGFSDERIFESIARQEAEIAAFLNRAKPYLGGFLRLQGDAPIQQNIDSALQFIESVSKRRYQGNSEAE